MGKLPNSPARNNEEMIEDFVEFYDEDGCYECGGEGWITAECCEDTCCCSDPDAEHGSIPCPNCNIEGN
jgi:hypothetical protein